MNVGKYCRHKITPVVILRFTLRVRVCVCMRVLRASVALRARSTRMSVRLTIPVPPLRYGPGLPPASWPAGGRRRGEGPKRTGGFLRRGGQRGTPPTLFLSTLTAGCERITSVEVRMEISKPRSRIKTQGEERVSQRERALCFAVLSHGDVAAIRRP